MIFQRHEKEHQRKVTTKAFKIVACLKPILQVIILTEETNKVDFTQKGATEK